MKKAKSILFTIIVLILFIGAMWGVLSVIDINLHNNPFDENYRQYASWNLFLI